MFFSEPFRQKRIANRTRKWDAYDPTVSGSNAHSQGAIPAFVHWHHKQRIEAEMKLLSSFQLEKKLVEVIGIEPVTPCYPGRCSQ